MSILMRERERVHCWCTIFILNLLYGYSGLILVTRLTAVLRNSNFEDMTVKI